MEAMKQYAEEVAMLNAMSPIRNISDRNYLDDLYRKYYGMLHNLVFLFSGIRDALKMSL